MRLSASSNILTPDPKMILKALPTGGGEEGEKKIGAIRAPFIFPFFVTTVKSSPPLENLLDPH